MQSIDLVLFNIFGAGFTPDPRLLQLALRTSTVAIWLIVAVIATTAWRHRATRGDALLVLLCAGLAQMLAHALAAQLDMPRPFMIGLSPDYAGHSGRGGLPSTHACVMAAVATYMAWRPGMRWASVVTALLAVVTGLARVYLGVHFPFDVLGGFALGALVGTLMALLRAWVGADPARRMVRFLKLRFGAR